MPIKNCVMSEYYLFLTIQTEIWPISFLGWLMKVQLSPCGIDVLEALFFGSTLFEGHLHRAFMTHS